MADIVHSSSRDILIRKIGYSSGLEFTRSRVQQLVDLYSQLHQLPDRSWAQLVHDRYHRESSDARVHLENFFNVIGVLRREQGRLVSLHVLESLTILKRLLEVQGISSDRAMDPVLLYALTIADAELLGNLLIVSFDTNQVERQLTKFREQKLSRFYSSYLNENDRRELHRCIDFKEMPKAGRRGPPKGPFADIRQVASENPRDFTVALSDDWFRKVPGRRESWARDLGLWSDEGRTPRGNEYLQMLFDFWPDEHSRGECAILQPTDLEFSANYLSWALEQSDLVSFNELVMRISGLFVERGSDRLNLSDGDLEEFVAHAKEIFSSNDVRFVRIRKELPFTIFSLVLMGYSVARGCICPSPQDVVSKFQSSKTRVLVRKSRNSLYSFSISSK